MKHGPVLKVALVMHQENVSVLGLPMAEERSVQNLYLHLGLWQLPPADRRQQRGAEPAQHGQQHADSFLHRAAGETGTRAAKAARTTGGEPAESGPRRGSFITRVLAGSSRWLRLLV